MHAVTVVHYTEHRGNKPQCYLPPDTSEHTPPDRPVTDLPSPEGWKAELTYMTGYIPFTFTRPQTVTHPGSNRAQCRLTMVIEAYVLTTRSIHYGATL